MCDNTNTQRSVLKTLTSKTIRYPCVRSTEKERCVSSPSGIISTYATFRMHENFGKRNVAYGHFSCECKTVLYQRLKSLGF